MQPVIIVTAQIPKHILPQNPIAHRLCPMRFVREDCSRNASKTRKKKATNVPSVARYPNTVLAAKTTPACRSLSRFNRPSTIVSRRSSYVDNLVNKQCAMFRLDSTLCKEEAQYLHRDSLYPPVRGTQCVHHGWNQTQRLVTRKRASILIYKSGQVPFEKR